MLVEKLEQISKELGWSFNYGNHFWQNLNDFEDDSKLPFDEKQIYCLLLWQDVERKFNEYSTPVQRVFNGELILCVRSHMDEVDYYQKYNNHIKQLRIVLEDFYNLFHSCEEFNLVRAKEIEVANTYDTNLDGIKLEFTISIDK